MPGAMLNEAVEEGGSFTICTTGQTASLSDAGGLNKSKDSASLLMQYFRSGSSCAAFGFTLL